jgi:hypothetical protein
MTTDPKVRGAELALREAAQQTHAAIERLQHCVHEHQVGALIDNIEEQVVWLTRCLSSYRDTLAAITHYRDVTKEPKP